ncbi:hypothetical protein N8913_02865 [Litoricola sp.]|jgi:hypothetical protein|nr:hypothetical protein [Litorivicinus sp.]MDC1076496.1 hypothetical protein [Litorivicinus sp.]
MSTHPVQQSFQLPTHEENDRNAASISILELACQSSKPTQDVAPEIEILAQKDRSSSLILDYLNGEELGI